MTVAAVPFEHERVPRRPPRKREPKVYERCPTPNAFTGASCKRRACRVCGGPWARSVGTVTEKALDHLVAGMAEKVEKLAGSVVMISVTPPGVELLPWACEKSHRNRQGEIVPHSGDRGCKVDDEAADRWSEYVRTEGWKKLRDAARKAVGRAGYPTAGLVVERFWEPQKRGVPHLHVIAAARTELEHEAANRFAAELARLAPEYQFGFVDRGEVTPADECPVTDHRDRKQLRDCACSWSLPQITPSDARRYLVSYLVGRNSHAKDENRKSSIRENISHPRMPRSLWWVTPALTSLSTSDRIETMRERLGVEGGTGVTMRNLRYVRWYYACLAGRLNTFPRLFGQKMFDVAHAALIVEPKKALRPGETREQAERRHRLNLTTMRLIQPPWELGPATGARSRKIELADEHQPAQAEPDPYMQLVMDVYTSWRSGVQIDERAEVAA